MELLIFVLIAGVAGYLISRSRLSKPIDDSAKKVADTTVQAAKTTGGWFSGAWDWVKKTLGMGKKPQNEVVDVTEVKPEPVTPPESASPAAKQPSRRKDEESKPE